MKFKSSEDVKVLMEMLQRTVSGPVAMQELSICLSRKGRWLLSLSLQLLVILGLKLSSPSLQSGQIIMVILLFYFFQVRKQVLLLQFRQKLLPQGVRALQMSYFPQAILFMLISKTLVSSFILMVLLYHMSLLALVQMVETMLLCLGIKQQYG